MAYRAKYLPTGKYYNNRIYPNLTLGRLRGWINTSRQGHFNKEWANMDNWVIEPYPNTEGFTFEGVATYEDGGPRWYTYLKSDVNLELSDLGNDEGDAPFILEDGVKYRVTIERL